MDLATQHVEQVGRVGHVDDLHVAVLVLAVELVLRGEDTGLLVTELEVTLHTARGMLGTLTVVTVRKRQDQTRALQPFRLSRCNELVNNTLSVVGEVTELSFPHNEGVGRGQGVTVFETKTIKQVRYFIGQKGDVPNLRSEFTERRVGDNEATLVLADVLKRSVGRLGLVSMYD